MSSVHRNVPTSRRGKALAAATIVVLAAVVGALSTWLGGLAWAGAWSAATAAVVILAALRTEQLARKRARPATIATLPLPLRKALRALPHRTNELEQAVERQNLHLRHVTGLVQSLGTHSSTHHDVSAVYAQLQAFTQLNGLFDSPPIVPAMRGWATSPDVVLHLVTLIMREQPPVVVECGSGASTVWLAAAARQFSPGTRIISLDHEAEFADRTRRHLRDNGLSEWADVRDAPLEPFGQPDGPQWFSAAALDGVADVGLVFVDGPPEATGEFARKPALEALASRLRDDAAIVLDDTVRRSEQATVSAWLESHPQMTERSHPFEKGAVELRWRS